ncbi:MAG: uncharacterized protein A8A55_0473 [Amphiamblys sp. WSBS2006]|nr:MAG: uncharacterized protein A8A55_0473 [Amphiamblys sp. WSBS2006]
MDDKILFGERLPGDAVRVETPFGYNMVFSAGANRAYIPMPICTGTALTLGWVGNKSFLLLPVDPLLILSDALYRFGLRKKSAKNTQAFLNIGESLDALGAPHMRVLATPDTESRIRKLCCILVPRNGQRNYLFQTTHFTSHLTTVVENTAQSPDSKRAALYFFSAFLHEDIVTKLTSYFKTPLENPLGILTA